MQKNKDNTNLEKLKDSVLEGMLDNKAQNIVVLNLQKIENAVADYFILCSGESSTQLDGIASSVVRGTRKELKEKPWHQEGQGTAEWILLDYISVVVHIFSHEKRAFYNIEELWADAEREDIPTID